MGHESHPESAGASRATACPAGPGPAVAGRPGDQPGRHLGRLLSVKIRSPGSDRMAALSAVEALAGLGLAGDRHADPFSPRQALLAGSPAYDRFSLDADTLRENLLFDFDTAGLESGALLGVGPGVILGLSFQCEACERVDRRRPGLCGQIGRQRGMLARVLRGGRLSVGDTVVELARRALPWSDIARERVARVLRAVPDDTVVDYRQLARLAGVQTTYCRTFPKIARDIGLGHKAVATGARPTLARWDGAGLFMPEIP